MRMAKFIAAGCLLVCMLLRSAAPGWTQGARSYQDPIRYGDLGFRHSLGVAQSIDAPALQVSGMKASDNIRGNGAKAGYTLNHGGLVPGSETVTVDGSLLRRNQDYYLDPASGMLVFSEPVRMSQLVRVSYRYVPEQDKQRSSAGAPSMSLSFGPKTSMGITIDQNAINNSSLDLLTYGLNVKTDLGGKSSMTNMMYTSSARESGRVSLNLQGEAQAKSDAPPPKTGSLFVHNSDFQTGKLTVKMNYQDVGKDFTGFNTLRQQKAAPEDVLKQMEKEKGIRRMGLQTDYSIGHGMSTGMGWGQISDEGGSVSRQSLSFGNSRSKITAEMQNISEGFKSFGALAPAEQQALGKESGMQRMNLTGNFKLNSDTQLKTNFSRVHAEDAGIAKYGLSLTGKQFSVSANFQDIDPNFTRINDLADPDKKAMAAAQGMKRYDLTTHYQASKSVTIDSFYYDTKHSITGEFRKQFRNNVVIAPSHGPKLSILQDQVSTGISDASTDTMHQQFRLDHQIGGMSFSAVHDTVAASGDNGGRSAVTTQSFHFDTDAKRRASGIGDWRSIKQDDGKFEDTKTLRLNYKLTPSLDFMANRLMVRTDQNDTVAQELNLTGKVFTNIGLRSRFAETTIDGEVAAKIRELSLVPDAGKDYGMFKQFKWSMAFSENESAGNVTAQAKSAHIEANVAKHTVGVDYSGGIAKDGQRPITRSFSIGGVPDPKKPVHYNMMYKMLDPGNGPSMLIRRYDAEWQINTSTKLTYNYFSYSEKPGGKIEPVGGEKLRLTMPINSRFGFVSQWENTEDYGQDIRKQTLSLGLTGKVNEAGAFEGSYGYDRVKTPSGPTTSWTYKLKYDYKMDADHYFTFSSKYTNWSGPHAMNPNDDDVNLQLDLRTLFN